MKLPDFDFSCVLESSDLPEPRQVLQMHEKQRTETPKVSKILCSEKGSEENEKQISKNSCQKSFAILFFLHGLY